MFQSWSPRQASSTYVTLRRVLPAYISTYLRFHSVVVRSLTRCPPCIYVSGHFVSAFFLIPSRSTTGQRRNALGQRSAINDAMMADTSVRTSSYFFFLFWKYRKYPSSKKEMSIIFPELFRLQYQYRRTPLNPYL